MFVFCGIKNVTFNNDVTIVNSKKASSKSKPTPNLTILKSIPTLETPADVKLPNNR